MKEASKKKCDGNDEAEIDDYNSFFPVHAVCSQDSAEFDISATISLIPTQNFFIACHRRKIYSIKAALYMALFPTPVFKHF